MLFHFQWSLHAIQSMQYGKQHVPTAFKLGRLQLATAQLVNNHTELRAIDPEHPCTHRPTNRIDKQPGSNPANSRINCLLQAFLASALKQKDSYYLPIPLENVQLTNSEISSVFQIFRKALHRDPLGFQLPLLSLNMHDFRRLTKPNKLKWK